MSVVSMEEVDEKVVVDRGRVGHPHPEAESQMTLKRTLLARLLDAVKQCQAHFGRKKELAADGDSRISCLLAQLEAIFHHGMRKHITPFRQFYEETAFLMDSEMSATLPQITQGLGSIVFALNIDNAELNSARSIPLETSDLIVEARKAPQPIMSLNHKGAKRGPSSERTRRRRKPLVNVVSFDSSTTRFSESEGTSKVQKHKSGAPLYKADSESVVSLIDDWNRNGSNPHPTPLNHRLFSSLTDRSLSCDSDAYSVQESLTEEDEKVFRDVVESMSNLSSVDVPDGLQLPPTAIDSDGLCLTNPQFSGTLTVSTAAELGNENQSHSFTSKNSAEEVGNDTASTSDLNETLEGNEDVIESLRAEVTILRKKHEDMVVTSDAKMKAVACENDILRNQLRGYVEAVQVMKAERRRQLDSISSTVSEDNETPNQSKNCSDIYEEKLIQVAEMHAELMEFNDRLIRQLNSKKRKINRLRNELTELRGPLLDDYSDDEDDNKSVTSSDTDTERSRRPLVNIWIPSTFMTGKGTDVHSVYQIYIRIRNAEWNVYRRYKDFLDLHNRLKKEDSAISTFKFPPKKAIGKKEKKFVEERRKQLEAYLRTTTNYVTNHFPEFSAIPLNKETLCKQMPFFGENVLVMRHCRNLVQKCLESN